MFRRQATAETWAEDRPTAERFASLDAPWGHGLEASVFADVPTLIITGKSNAEYEAIAARLADHGAQHVHLAGARHRPQDHPEFEEVVS